MAAPIIIHILNKRRFKRVDWAAMEFLRRAYKIRRKRVKLEEFLLLAMRCLIVALFGAALAQPFFDKGPAAGELGDARTDRIIVLDDSLSMHARSGISSPAEEASKLLRSWISDLASDGSADSITLLRTSSPAQPLFSRVPLTEEATSQILSELKDLPAAPVAGDLAGAFTEVEKALGDNSSQGVNKTVYVISDMRATDWAATDKPGVDGTLQASMKRIRDKATAVFVIDMAGEKGGANLVIEDIAPSDVALVAGTLTRFEVTVRNYDDREVNNVRVSLTAGSGAPQIAELEPIPARGISTASFNVTLPEPPSVEEGDELPPLPPLSLSAAIASSSENQIDALAEDDERYFPVRLSSGIRVLVVDGDPSGTFGQSETYFIKRALSPRGRLRSGVTTDIIDESEFATIELDGYQVIYLCNVYAVPDDRRIALEKWVSAGGGLVVTLGDQIDQEDWNTRMFRDGEGLLPMRLDAVDGDDSEQNWVYFDPQTDQHPLFKLFEGGQNPLRSSVKVFQWWEAGLAEVGEEDVATDETRQDTAPSVLAAFTNAEQTPAIVERPFGDGRVVAIATSVDVDWNNWPLDISFLIVMQELTRHVAQSNAREGEMAVGDAILQEIDLAEARPDLQLTLPSGDTQTIQAKPPEGADSGTTDWIAQFDETASPGFYTVTVHPTDGTDPREVLFAANLDTGESDLAIASRDAVSRDLAQAGVEYMQSPTSFASLEDPTEKSEIWRYVLFALLALMALELFYGCWIALKRRSTRVRSFNQMPGSIPRAAIIVFAAVLGSQVCRVDAQDIILGGQVKPAVPAGEAENPVIKPPTEFPGAQLKTNEDIGDILEQADDLVQQKRYELATVLWQKALDTTADTLFTRDEWKVTQGEYSYQVYRPVIAEIESTLANLPAEALKAYQLKADGDAEALLATAGNGGRRQALGEVTARFFLSSIGDDAAFELASLFLDDHEYFGAARLLRKLLDRHPSLSVNRTEILKRLAVAEARSGEADRAAQTTANLKASAAALPISFLNALNADLNAAESHRPSESSELANSVPVDFPGSPAAFALSWEQPFKLRLPEDWPEIPDPPKSKPKNNPRPYGYPVQSTTNQSDAGLRNAWKTNQLEPVIEVLTNDDHVIFRNEERLAAIDANSGEAKWLGMRSASTSPPGTQRDFYFFRDFAAQSSFLADGTVYTIEGQTLDFPEEDITGVSPADLGVDKNINRAVYSGAEISRARDNRLAAYDLRTGKLLWMRRANEPDSAKNTRISFAGRPQPVSGGLLAVPVHEGRLLWLYFIGADSGATVRRTQVCQEPAECLPSSTVSVAVSGSDTFVATGAGALACIDANSGEVRWCTVYSRPIPQSMNRNINPQVMARQMAQMMATGQSRPMGWTSDRVFVYGNIVVLLPSDCDRVLGFSRLSGEFAWEAPMLPEGEKTPVSVVGYANGRIFTRGNDFVRCYDAKGGRIVWETETPPQFGNSLITSECVYASTEKAIIRISADSGEMLATIPIHGSEEPPGTLFSDGKRLFSLSPGEVRAFDPK